MDTLKKKRFHLICVAVIVGYFFVKAVVAARSSIYILSREQIFGMVFIAIIPLGWLYEIVKKQELSENVSNLMTAWYLGFTLAYILLSGIVEIKEKDRLGKELRAKMTDEEWEELNEQIKEDARQDYYENRHP